MKLGIFVENPKYYYMLLKELKLREIEFVDLHEGEYKNVAAVITDTDISFINAVRDSDPERAVRKSLSYLYGKKRFDEIIIGIDPGVRTGIVVLGDGYMLEGLEVTSPFKVRDIIDKIYADYRPEKFSIKIGRGDIHRRNIIVNSLYRDYNVEVVDEDKTTPAKNRNIEAAKKIAAKNGEFIKRKMKNRIRSGQIRDVQRMSRIQSNNEITISRELAILVIRGNITMDEAIELEKRKK
ncbi:MAG: hypothetical protein ACP5RZ_01205 [Thermoplasmata archaeon]